LTRIGSKNKTSQAQRNLRRETDLRKEVKFRWTLRNSNALCGDPANRWSGIEEPHTSLRDAASVGIEDRIIGATSLVEGLTLLTAQRGIRRSWALHTISCEKRESSDAGGDLCCKHTACYLSSHVRSRDTRR